eukprot:maker-scaffold_9-snap-gene-11.13-mRNA-1 protein AED:0.29 eAED:0.33 QI:0/0/0/1/0/0/4/0/206
MQRETVSIEVGQCGNQIGRERMWSEMLKEHGSCSRGGIFDISLNSFFRNERKSIGEQCPVGSKIYSLKSRAVIIDTEEGDLNFYISLGEQETTSFMGTPIMVSYTCNEEFVFVYRDNAMESIRKEAERCSNLTNFLLLHSLGGGTGSGFGTRIIEEVQTVYGSKKTLVDINVFPDIKGFDDVVTSPYNALFCIYFSLNNISSHKVH